MTEQNDIRTIAQQVVEAIRLAGHRHPVLPAGRAERRLLRRPRRRPRHPPDRQPPRAGRGLHGERRLARRRQAVGVLRRARAGHAQRRRGAHERLLVERPQCWRSSARSPRSPAGAGSACCTSSPTSTPILGQLTKHAELLDDGESATKQVQSALDALVSGRPRPVSLEVPVDRWRTPAPGPLRAAVAERRPPIDPSAIDRAADALRRRRASADRRRRRRPGRGRADRPAGRAAPGAGHDAPHGPRRDPHRPPAVRPPRRSVTRCGRPPTS